MTILYVEESSDDVLFFGRALKQIAPKVPWRVVVDLEQAKCYLIGEGKYEDRKQYPFPTLIIAGMKLPDGEGIELLKWAQARRELSRVPFCLFDGVPDHLREPLPDPRRQQYFEKPSLLREWPVIIQQMLTWSEGVCCET